MDRTVASHPLQQKIDGLARRARRLAVLRALGRVVAIALGGLSLLGGLDYLMRFETPVARALLSVTAVTVVLLSAYRYLVRALKKPLDPVMLARWVEHRYPEMGDALASSLSFLHPGRQEADGSLALRERVIADTAARTSALDFSVVASARPARRALLWAGGLAVAAAVLFRLAPEASAIALVRLAKPLGGPPWPQRTRLAIVDHRLWRQRVARDAVFEPQFVSRGPMPAGGVSLRIGRKAEVSADDRVLRLEAEGDVWRARWEGVQESFAYRLEMTDGDTAFASRWIAVAVDGGARWPAPGAANGPQVPVARPIEFAPEGASLSIARLALEHRRERVVRGEAFEAEVVDVGGGSLPDDVCVEYRLPGPNGSVVEETQRLQVVDNRAMAERPAVNQDFWYRFVAGDDTHMAWVPVSVVAPPRIESFSVTVRPPRYTGWPSAASGKAIRALRGSEVQIVATANRPLQSASLSLDGGTRVAGRLDARSLTAQFRFVLENSGSYSFELLDRESLSGGGDARWDIRAVADQPPTAAIDSAAAERLVTPTARVPLDVSAADDISLTRVELAYTLSAETAESTRLLYRRSSQFPQQSAPMDKPVERPPGDRRQFHIDWDLAQLGLSPGTLLIYRVRASDDQPRSAESESKRLRVLTLQELRERLASRQAFVLAEIGRLLEAERENRRQMAELESASGRKAPLLRNHLDRLRAAEMQQRQIERGLTSRSDGVAGSVETILSDMEHNGLGGSADHERMTGVLKEVERLERDHLPIVRLEQTAAIKSAEMALDGPPGGAPAGRLPPSLSILAPRLSVVGRQQDEVIAALERLLGRLAGWKTLEQFHRGVSELLRRQEQVRDTTAELGRRTIAKRVDALPAAQQAELKAVSDEQLDLARQWETVERSLGEAALDAAADSSSTLASALEQARRSGVPASMRSAGEAAQENRMGEAIASQQQAIDAIRALYRTLGADAQGEQTDWLRAFEQRISGLYQRQGQLYQQTQRLETLLADKSGASRVATELAGVLVEQRALETETRQASATAGAQSVFAAACNAAIERMSDAAVRLQARQADSMTLAAQSDARRLLGEVLAALKPGEKSDGEGQSGPGQGAGDSADAREADAARRRMAELKLLRQMQAGLNARTAAVYGALDGPAPSADGTAEFDVLAAEQGELARLLVGLLQLDEPAAPAESAPTAEPPSDDPLLRSLQESQSP